MAEEACRLDLWLWRARFFRTRGLAAQRIAAGGVRLAGPTGPRRIDKPGRLVRPGEELTFAVGGRLFAVRIEALGERRGPASEARRLYSRLDETPAAAAIDMQGGGLT